jgi:hypothetical protein
LAPTWANTGAGDKSCEDPRIYPQISKPTPLVIVTDARMFHSSVKMVLEERLILDSYPFIVAAGSG